MPPAKALELFLGLIISESSKVTQSRGSKKVEAYHLCVPSCSLFLNLTSTRKHAVDTTEMLDFLKEIVQTVADPSAGGTIDLSAEGGKGRRRGRGKKAGAGGKDGEDGEGGEEGGEEGEGETKKKKRKSGKKKEKEKEAEVEKDREEHDEERDDQDDEDEDVNMDDTGRRQMDDVDEDWDG